MPSPPPAPPPDAPVVRDLADLLAAIDGGVATVVSLPGAGASLGAGAWAAIVAAARAARPGRAFVAVLDCADRPGHVAAAWRAGVTDVAFAADAPARPRLEALAAATGVRLWSTPSERGTPDLGSLQSLPPSANQPAATAKLEQRDVR